MSKKKPLRRKVVIFPYDNNWPKLFTAEKARILAAINNKTVRVEHVGSTAIPGLAAKPIVDIMVGIKSLRKAKSYIKRLETLGYEYIPSLKDIPEWHLLHRGPTVAKQTPK